ncbi:TPA: hypothetical protein ACH3X3_007160 [Trebouxia sp. C0006]
MHVLVLAKGTRGDVQPAAVLAHALLSRQPQIVLHFVTHLDHEHWLKDVLHPSGIKCLFLDTLPARVWNTQDDSTKKRARHETVSQMAEAFQSDHDLGKSIAAIHNSFVLAQESAANQQPQRTLIIFNLFSLEALHLAEALGISCLAISPCLPPYTAPNSFPRQFRKAWPALHNALQMSLEGCVSWAEVEHWLWPAFSQRWSIWRRDCLNLTSIPFTTCTIRSKLGKDKPGSPSPGTSPPDNNSRPGKCPDSRASSCRDPTSAAEDDVNLDNNVDGERHELPHSIPLLYGLSEHVIQRPGYWPASVHCCGFWQQQGPHNASDRRKQLQAFITPILHDTSLAEWVADHPLVCIDFGSMGCMGLLPDPHYLVKLLLAALQKADAKGILLTGGWKPLLSAVNMASVGQEQPAMIAAEGSIPHHLLLPECNAVMHHGGAGTSAAVLTAGLPHIVCPFHFDQFSWAERLTYLGVAVQASTKVIVGPSPVQQQQATADTVPCPTGQMNAPQTRSHVNAAASDASCSGTDPITAAVADRLASQMKTVLGGGLQQQCQDLKARLAEEDGVSNAVDMISQHMANAVVPAPDALQKMARQSKLQSDWYPDRQVKAQLVSEAGAASAQASTAAADASIDLVREFGAGPIQGAVQLPNGWSVPAQSQVEALFIYREIVEQLCYLQNGIYIKDQDVIMDVGANIGLFSWWVMQGGPDRGVPAVVWAVEPLPANLAVLQANVEQHGLLDHVQIIPQAIAEAEGEKVFRYYPAMPGNSTCHVQEKEQLQRSIMPDHFFLGSQDRTCPVTTISCLMEKHGICQVDLLKVDVEGCELQALQGIQDHHWPHIRQIILEVHDTRGRREHVIQLLQAQNYLVSCVLGLAPETYLVYARRT